MEASQEAQVRNHEDLSKVMERRWGRSARKNRRGRTSRRWEVRREKFPAATGQAIGSEGAREERWCAHSVASSVFWGRI